MAANGSEKAFCVLIFHECRSVTIVQRQFRTKFGKQPPSDNSIWRLYALFQEIGCVCKRKSTGRPAVTEEQVQQVRQVHTSKFLLQTCRYVTETWSVVLLNKKIHILLSQVYCVWQVVKTPKIILNNNPVHWKEINRLGMMTRELDLVFGNCWLRKHRFEILAHKVFATKEG